MPLFLPSFQPLFSASHASSPRMSSHLIVSSVVVTDCRHRHQHRHADLLLATIDAIVTSFLAYPAAVAIGAVLLQTSPTRGLPGGRMEAFLRAMREVSSRYIYLILRYNS